MLNHNLMTNNAVGDRRGSTMCMVDLKKDLITKPAYNNNSWFAFGRYETEGHTINLLFHLMGMKMPVIGTMYQSVVTVYNETTGEYFAKDHLFIKGKCEVHEHDFFVKTPSGVMTGDFDHMTIHITEGKIKADLELEAIHYPILIGGNSILDMCEMCIHEYSVPRMNTKGSLTFKGRTYDLTGNGYSWFDRQWQNIDYAHSTMKWSWMAISLDNGDIISVFDTNLPGWEDNILSVLHPDGSQTNLRPIPPFVEGEKEYWVSAESKRKYPVQWELKIPELDAVLEVTPFKKEQEIKSVMAELHKYEGSCKVTGTYKGQPVSGHALVEMIGHWYNK